MFKISVEHSMTVALYEQIQTEEIMLQDTYGEIANAFRNRTLQEVVLQMRKSEGFQRESIDNDNLPYEIPYVNPSCGLCIELHLDLFPEESGAYGHLNREFSEAYDTCIKEMIQGRTVWTLSPTLHMLYLICHSLKHFLHTGFGIRQVCDMVMMDEHYGEEIDWDYIQSRLKELRMDGFWNGLLEIGKNYLDFSIEKAKYPKNH